MSQVKGEDSGFADAIVKYVQSYISHSKVFYGVLKLNSESENITHCLFDLVISLLLSNFTLKC